MLKKICINYISTRLQKIEDRNISACVYVATHHYRGYKRILDQGLNQVARRTRNARDEENVDVPRTNAVHMVLNSAGSLLVEQNHNAHQSSRHTRKDNEGDIVNGTRELVGRTDDT